MEPGAPPPRGAALRLATAMRAGFTPLARLMAALAGWNYVLCALFVTFDVVARNAFRFSSASTVELTGYMLAGGIAWGLAAALLDRAHIRVDVLVNRLPMRPRAALHLFSLLLLAAMAGFVAWAAWDLVGESALFDAHDNSALRIPMVIPQGAWAIGISAFCLAILLLLLECLLLLAAGRYAEVDARLGQRSFQDETAEALAAVGFARKPGDQAR